MEEKVLEQDLVMTGLSYNMDDIIKYVLNKIAGKKNNIELEPYYENFKGKS